MADLEKLDNAIKELEIQSNDLKEFNKVYSEIGKLKGDILANLDLLKKNNDGFNSIATEIKSSLEKSHEQLKRIESELLQKMDSSLVSRLDKHKSDIQVEIRNEGTQIQRSFENALTLNFNNMESKIKEQFSLQNKQLSTIKVLAFIILGIGIGLAIGLYLK
jgi:protein subunit release factor A